MRKIALETCIDALSDSLKKEALKQHLELNGLPEIEVAARFDNSSAGPQFWPGGKQPLYLTPACELQEPVAWMSDGFGRIVTIDTSAYREDIKWLPLYLAR